MIFDSDLDRFEVELRYEEMDQHAARGSMIRVTLSLHPEAWRSIRAEHQQGGATLTDIINDRLDLGDYTLDELVNEADKLAFSKILTRFWWLVTAASTLWFLIGGGMVWALK